MPSAASGAAAAALSAADELDLHAVRPKVRTVASPTPKIVDL